MHHFFAKYLCKLCGVDDIEQFSSYLKLVENEVHTPELVNFISKLNNFSDLGKIPDDQFSKLLSNGLANSILSMQSIHDKLNKPLHAETHGDIQIEDQKNPNQTSSDDEIETLLNLLPHLIEQQEQRRQELANQRFAMDQHAIISITDKRGNITFVNDKFIEVSGYSREELMGKNHRLINSGLHSQNFFNGMWKTIANGKVWRAEICNRAKNGSFYWVDSTIVPFLNEAGRPVQYISIRTDITQQKMLAEKIATSEHKYRSLVENVHEVIFQMDIQGRWLFLNQAWSDISGYDVKDSLGKNFLDFVHPHDLDKAISIFHQLSSKEISAYKGELRFCNSEGKSCWLEVSVQCETEISLDEPIFTGTLHDISERRRAAQLQSEFISVVSHELRTPLTSIRGSLSLLEAGLSGVVTEPQQKLLSIAHKNSQRLIALVNDILDMEKLMADKMSFQMKSVDVVSLVEQAMESNSAYADTYSTRFVLCKHPTTAVVMADAERMMQVLSNLLSNAAKFSPPDRSVDISISMDSENTRVSICDYGPGIPLEFRPRIFSAFAQADSSDTRKQGGTGLGLKISKTLIEKMGGTIGFESELGAGTCFWFSLPVAN